MSDDDINKNSYNKDMDHKQFDNSKNINAIINDLLNEKIQVHEHGKTTSLTARQVLARKMVLEAAKGNLTAINFILDQIPANELAEELILFVEELDMGVM